MHMEIKKEKFKYVFVYLQGAVLDKLIFAQLLRKLFTFCVL